MHTIYKYTLPITNRQHLYLPKDARILHVGTQNDNIYIWAHVDTRKEDTLRTIRIYSTGQNIDDYDQAAYMHYLNTVQFPDSGLVFHVYEEFQT